MLSGQNRAEQIQTGRDTLEAVYVCLTVFGLSYRRQCEWERTKRDQEISGPSFARSSHLGITQNLARAARS